MKKLLVLVAVLLLNISLFAGDNKTKSPAAAAFEKMKTLAGEWQAKGADGKMRYAKYELVAGGTCLQETFRFEDDDSHTMVTMYHVDGDNLMLTHYCIANNQPRMRAENISADLKEIAFNFVDATNLPDPNAGHMYKAVFQFNDENEFSSAWTFRKDGKDTFTEQESYKRVK